MRSDQLAGSRRATGSVEYCSSTADPRDCGETRKRGGRVSDRDRDLPWTALPPSLTPLLVGHVPVFTEELLAAVHRDVPVYATSLDGPLRPEIQHGVESALTRFLDLAASEQPALRNEDWLVYELLGRA